MINFRNDAKTRAFFVAEVGVNFKVNHYLREFSKQENEGSLTYGDLLKGWFASLLDKKPPIGKQFEYNQVQRDFHAHEENRTSAHCRSAWKLLRSFPGDPAYAHYIKLKKEGCFEQK